MAALSSAPLSTLAEQVILLEVLHTGTAAEHSGFLPATFPCLFPEFLNLIGNAVLFDICILCL